MFAMRSAEKGSADDSYTIKTNSRAEKAKLENGQAFINRIAAPPHSGKAP